MSRQKNFAASTRVSWNISKGAAQMVRIAAIQLGQSPAAVLDAVIRQGLHLVVDKGSNQVGGDAPASRTPSRTELRTPLRTPSLRNPPKPLPTPPPPAGPAGDGWTPATLQAALDQVRRKRSELQTILGLKNVDIWWSPPRHKGVGPSVPAKWWGQIDQVLLGWGWVSGS